MSKEAEGSKKEEGSSCKVAGPDPPRYYNPSTWKLISQGAEARVWYVPSFVTGISAAICKERFPKAYRVQELDVSITKSRTRAEVRSMVKCRRGGVLTPAILGVHMPSNQGRSSACIFMEYIPGCTVRQYLEEHSTHTNSSSDDELKREGCSSDEEDGVERKKARVEENKNTPSVKLTRIDAQSILIATEIGLLVAKMHNLQLVHGDLTTSNILLRNPPSEDENGNWKPELVLIDFGLATNTSGTGSKGGGGGHEEKAVDLYVLERAFEATHPGSKQLVNEILRAYKGACKTSDSVLQRLSQVRLRGRKRECFG